MTKICPTFFIFFALFSLFSIFPTRIFAQKTSIGVAVTLQIPGEIADGDIICAIDVGNKPCSIPYDPRMFGVVSLNPAVSLSDKELENGKPVVNSGKVYVRVTSANGVIRVGDYITASDKAGIGMKALKSGFVLGSAQMLRAGR